MESMTNDTIEQSFPVGTPAELSVSAVSGRVAIRAGSDGSITVRAEKRGSEHAKAATLIDLRQEGNRVSVHTTQAEGMRGGSLNAGKNLASVEYDITVPLECTIGVKTVSADVTVDATRGALQTQTVSGDVAVTAVAGPISLNTVSGDVVVRDLEGTLTLHTTSGDVGVADSSLRGFNLHSVSGDFVIETPLTRGERYYANTVSGDLRLAVPDGTGATVQMKSVSGDVVSNLPNSEIIKSGRRHWQGRINGGGANVEMESVSGDLIIARGTQSTPERVVEDTVPDSSQAGSVLELLEQGEIDVEEALARLQGEQRGG